MTLNKSLNVVVIVQARMGSTRLPGKVLKEVMGKSLLAYQLERLKRVKNASLICVATTHKAEDMPIVELCQHLGVQCFRGEELDVLERYRTAADAYEADAIVRITSDCPLIDPEVVDQVIQEFIAKSPQVDYVSNVYPERTFPRGMDTEMFSSNALKTAAQEAKNPNEREHVTLYFYHHPKRFTWGTVKGSGEGVDCRLTVDTIEDFNLISLILENLYPRNPQFTLREVLELLKQHPEWKKINAHIIQR